MFSNLTTEILGIYNKTREVLVRASISDYKKYILEMIEEEEYPFVTTFVRSTGNINDVPADIVGEALKEVGKELGIEYDEKINALHVDIRKIDGTIISSWKDLE